MSVKRKLKKDLEAEIKQLRNDLKEIVNGNPYLALKYRTEFDMRDKLAEVIWSGCHKPYKEGDLVKFDGIIHKVIK